MALRLSIVVIGFDMKRELPRTVLSLLPPYQRGVSHDEVEIIVVDNGSVEPVCRDWFPPDADIRVVRVDGAACRHAGQSTRVQGLRVPTTLRFSLMVPGWYRRAW